LRQGALDIIRSKYGIPAEASVVSYIGRIVRDKGLIELVAAWKVLREEFPMLHLLVVGRFESQDPIPSNVADTLRHDPRIHLTGFIDNNNIPPIYVATDVFVLPSYREGLPLTLLEAAAMELPVVATRIPGCIDAVHEGVTGTLVPPYDAVALEDAIRTYINGPDLRQRHGRAGRVRILREFCTEAICELMYRDYVRLLREKGVFISDTTAEEQAM
jgi:glycosyltransferase involved in cell wall biosynthesis